MKTLSKILLSSETPEERETTKQLTKNLIESSMTIEEKLREKLRKEIKENLKITPNKIKERKAPLNKKGEFENPFPIGTRSVYVFAKGGEISDAHKWKLFVHFND